MNLFTFVQRLASIYAELSRLSDDIRRLDTNVSRHDADLANLRERVARLEEARQTVRAEVESELLKAVRQIERETEKQLNALRKSIASKALPSSKTKRKSS